MSESRDESDGYELLLLAESGNLRHYRLVKSGLVGRMESTDIVFTADHTAIFGDLCPGRYGVASTFGVGLSFLCHKRGSHYLAEKFLPQDWHKELAHAGLDDMAALEDAEDYGKCYAALTPDAVRDLHGMIDDYDVRRFHDWFHDNGFEGEDTPGYGYEPRSLRILVAINRRFAALYSSDMERRRHEIARTEGGPKSGKAGEGDGAEGARVGADVVIENKQTTSGETR